MSIKLLVEDILQQLPFEFGVALNLEANQNKMNLWPHVLLATEESLREHMLQRC